MHFTPLPATDHPAWLTQALLQLPPIPSAELPDWCVLDALPPLPVGPHRLSDPVLRQLLRSLQTSPLDSPDALLRAVRQHLSRPQLDDFAVHLLHAWHQHGAAPQHAWLLRAVASLGDTAAIDCLAHLIPALPSPVRTLALESLAASPAPLALLYLLLLARRAGSLLREQILPLLVRLARQRNLALADLDDLALPDLGFQPDGGPWFDHGRRRFQAVLAPGASVLLRDAHGHLRPTLPPRATPASRTRWFRLRRQVRAFLRLHSLRLGDALVEGRRWNPRLFRARLLAHPLLAHLARSLLWGAYDDRGRLITPFRISEDATFLDADESPVPWLDINSIRLVHPIELPDAVCSAWQTSWTDHQLVPPFPQLTRPVVRLTDTDARAITTYRDGRLRADLLARTLRRDGWEPLPAEPGRPREMHTRLFATWGVGVVLHHRTLGPASPNDPRPSQELTAAWFLCPADLRDPLADVTDALPLGQVPPLLVSEMHLLLRRLHARTPH
ncbi:MAG: DUF4132 domain-containing protein [Gemmataceae bacterium]